LNDNYYFTNQDDGDDDNEEEEGRGTFFIVSSISRFTSAIQIISTSLRRFE